MFSNSIISLWNALVYHLYGDLYVNQTSILLQNVHNPLIQHLTNTKNLTRTNLAEILVFSCKPFSLFRSFKFLHGISTNMPEVADLHSWFQPMKSSTHLITASLAHVTVFTLCHWLKPTTIDNMRYYGDLIVFFKHILCKNALLL